LEIVYYMLTELVLKNFKLFKEDTHIPLSNINLFTGINGRGKSTVLQSLILMKQSPEYDRTTNKIVFNGDDVRLGTFKDVKNINTQPSETIEFTFRYTDFSIKYFLLRSETDPMVAEISHISVEGQGDKFRYQLFRNNESFKILKKDQAINPTEFITDLHNLFINDITFAYYKGIEECERVKKSLNFTRIHYVSADRIGPKLFYEEKSLKDFPTVGALGQDTVNVLFHSENNDVNEDFIANIPRFFHVATEDLGTTVGLQTTFWLDKIFKGTKYQIIRSEESNLLSLLISPEGTFNYYKTTNVGYGYTYILPIIVAGLIAKSGDILIVENPEAHLHPFAQSIIAKFLTLVAIKDVQVIIESHSEHILNGLRIGVYDKTISNNTLNVLYFDRELPQYFEKVIVDEAGSIQNWPPDFFDQATKDLNYLFGV
jgi:predicted ATPase